MPKLCTCGIIIRTCVSARAGEIFFKSVVEPRQVKILETCGRTHTGEKQKPVVDTRQIKSPEACGRTQTGEH